MRGTVQALKRLAAHLRGMSDMNMTPAQAAQQNNRDDGGRYAHRHRAEVDLDLNPRATSDDVVRVIFDDVDHPAPNFCQYLTEYQPQPAWVALDCRDGRMFSGYSGDNLIPLAVWHGHVQRWTVAPEMTGAALNDLMAEMAQKARPLVECYESRWDGNNMVATWPDLTEEEIYALEDDLQGLADEYSEDRSNLATVITRWDSLGWIDGFRDEMSADTTDEQIELWVAEWSDTKIHQEYLDGVVYVEPEVVDAFRDSLTGYRDRLRAERDDEN